MQISALNLPGVKLVVPKRFTDARGPFSEIWIDRHFREEIANVAFVQDNESVSVRKGTVRGLHFQKPPFAQGKLVRVVRGSILDVAVDYPQRIPTYGQHLMKRLDALEGAQLWVPPGFLHGFCTLEDETVVFYKVTSYYRPGHDGGVLWSDPDLRIEWPVEADCVVLSEKTKDTPACVICRTSLTTRDQEEFSFEQESQSRSNRERLREGASESLAVVGSFPSRISSAKFPS